MPKSAYTLKFLYNPLFADELQVGDYLNDPGEAFIRVLSLQFQPSLLNILPLYIALLLALPSVDPVASGGMCFWA